MCGVFLFYFFNRSFPSEALPHCCPPRIITTEFFLRVHSLPHKSLHFHLTNLIAGSVFNPPYTEKPLQLFIWTRNLMECAWCSEQLPALKASPCWGQLGCLGLHIAGIWAFLTSAAEEINGRKKEEGQRNKLLIFSLFVFNQPK